MYGSLNAVVNAVPHSESLTVQPSTMPSPARITSSSPTFVAVLWALCTFANPAKLVMPLDTHIHRITSFLGLNTRKSADWKTARALTDRLARFDASDPVRYDFALCRLGILDRCGASHSCPKIIEHFGAAEVWGLKLTPEWVGSAGDNDLALPSLRKITLSMGLGKAIDNKKLLESATANLTQIYTFPSLSWRSPSCPAPTAASGLNGRPEMRSTNCRCRTPRR